MKLLIITLALRSILNNQNKRIVVFFAYRVVSSTTTLYLPEALSRLPMAPPCPPQTPCGQHGLVPGGHWDSLVPRFPRVPFVAPVPLAGHLCLVTLTPRFIGVASVAPMVAV